MRTAVGAIAVPAFCGALLPGVAVSNALLNVMSGSSTSALDFVSAVTVALAIGAVMPGCAICQAMATWPGVAS